MTTRIKSRLVAACLLTFAIAAVVGVKLAAQYHASKTAQMMALKGNSLIVHEWGTFTSIAGKDGVALEGASVSIDFNCLEGSRMGLRKATYSAD